MDVIVQLNEAGDAVTGAFAMAQPGLERMAVVDDADPRYVAFLAGPPAQQLTQKIAAGLPVTCAAAPGIDGIYAIGAADQQQVMAVAQYIAAFGKFPANQATLAWPDVDGASHVFATTELFMEFARAAADYVASCAIAARSSPIVWPTTPIAL